VLVQQIEALLVGIVVDPIEIGLEVDRLGLAGSPLQRWRVVDRRPCPAIGDQAGQTKRSPHLLHVAILGAAAEPSSLKVLDSPDQKLFGVVGDTIAMAARIAAKHDAIDIDIEELTIHKWQLFSAYTNPIQAVKRDENCARHVFSCLGFRFLEQVRRPHRAVVRTMQGPHTSG